MANPAFNRTFENTTVLEGEPCTIQGSVNKTFLLLIVAVAAFFVNFNMIAQGNVELASSLSVLGIVAGLILALVISFKPKASPYLAPVYAFCEGLALGFISAAFEAQFQGIAIQTFLMTFGTLAAMLVLYTTKVIRVTEKLRSTVLIATLGIGAVYLVEFIMSLFHHHIPALYASTPVGIVFSVVVCLIAAFNLLLDFAFIERAAQNYLPKYFEWYGAFGLLVTLVWLYIELLRLLAKLRDR